MTALASDTFTRANNLSNWGTASDGSTWSIPSGSATLTISSNQGLATAVTALTYLRIGSGTSADAEGLVRLQVSSTNYTACGLTLRATGTTTFYRFRINSNSASIGIGISKTVSGTTTTLATATFTPTLNSGYWLRGRVQGSNLYVKVWATGTTEPTAWTVTTTDSSITGAGGYGLHVNTTGSADYARFDSLTIFTPANVLQALAQGTYKTKAKLIGTTHGQYAIRLPLKIPARERFLVGFTFAYSLNGTTWVVFKNSRIPRVSATISTGVNGIETFIQNLG